ncbi:MAG TPA: high frequency lysogenization protein HflD [Gammaproteobacteria bacterium]
MTLKTLTNQVFAFAGIYQACNQVKSVAWHGRSDAAELDSMIGSIFKIDSADIDDIYGGKNKLRQGLELLTKELNPEKPEYDMEITRYILTLLAIHRKLLKRPQLQKLLRDEIDKSSTQLKHYGTNHPNTWAALGEAYQRTISTLTPRIMVNGDRMHLSNNDNAAKIRALLLAGLRSAVLWGQCGGSRLSFIFNRRNYFLEASNLLTQIL